METAQQAYARLLRDFVAPALRAQGLKGSGQTYTLPHPEMRVAVHFQCAARDRGELEFTVEVSAVHDPTMEAFDAAHRTARRQGRTIPLSRTGHWGRRLGFLMPVRRDIWWTIRAGEPIESVATEVVSALVEYGLPAAREAAAQPIHIPPEYIAAKLREDTEVERMRRKALDDLERLSPPPIRGQASPPSAPILDRYWPLRAAPRGATATPALVAAVAAYRAAGWFRRERGRSDADLAAALMATWRDVEGAELLDDPRSLDRCLLILDSDRTLYDDIEADVSEGMGAYVELLQSLAARSGGSHSITDIAEDWTTEPGGVVVRFSLNGRHHTVQLDSIGDVLDPGMITALNALIQPSQPRFFFVDDGGQFFIVTRATAGERQRLQELRPIRLDEQPPSWWR